MASFSPAYALIEIPSGVWGDRIGLKALFIRIVLFWSLFTALTGLAIGLVSLIIIRFLFGMGEPGTYPNCIDGSFPLVSRSGNWPLLNQLSEVFRNTTTGQMRT